MSRFSHRLSDTSFDLAVIGGGVHGLFAALEAATHGASVVLVERDDYGAGLSSNHQRTVHGGLRALQSGQIGKTRAQIAERRDWALMAPHLLRPLPFLFPTHRALTRSRLAVGTALRLYDRLGRHRNDDVPPALHLPASRLYSVAETAARFPGLVPEGVTGGAVWYDYQVRHPDRLNWLIALAAQRAGALLCNHADAVDLLRDGRRVTGVRVADRLSSTIVDVAAHRVLLCAGGALPALHARFGLGASPRLVRASGLLVDRPAIDMALAARGSSGRMLTATPWNGYWLIGTFQTNVPVESGSNPRPSRAEIDAMLDDTNAAFPTLRLRRQDVRLVHSGLTPAVVLRRRAELMPDSRVIAHGADGTAGVFSIVGVKFTTARSTALRALRQMGLAPAQTSSTPPRLPHGLTDDADARLRAACLAAGVALDDDVFTHLVDWYATEAVDVLELSAAVGGLQRLASGTPVLDGEVTYAVERSHAASLADVVLRRTRLGTTGHPGGAALDRAAELLTTALSWSPETRQAQLAEVEARFA